MHGLPEELHSAAEHTAPVSRPSSLTYCQPKKPACSFISTQTPGRLMKADASDKKSPLFPFLLSPFCPCWNMLRESWLILPNISYLASHLCVPSPFTISFILCFLCLSNSLLAETHDCLGAFWTRWKSLLSLMWLLPWVGCSNLIRRNWDAPLHAQKYTKCIKNALQGSAGPFWSKGVAASRTVQYEFQRWNRCQWTNTNVHTNNVCEVTVCVFVFYISSSFYIYI